MVILVMGVAGSGKTTIGSLLARQLQWDFYDADDFHPPANIEKMRRGVALTDEDRLPWLEELQQVIEAWLEKRENVILACSALKAEYRRMLMQDPVNMRLVHLRGDFTLLAHRIAERKGHFLAKALLPSQFEALEEPTEGLIVDVSHTPEDIVKQIKTDLKL